MEDYKGIKYAIKKLGKGKGVELTVYKNGWLKKSWFNGLSAQEKKTEILRLYAELEKAGVN
jgi:hypothetical protein